MLSYNPTTIDRVSIFMLPTAGLETLANDARQTSGGREREHFKIHDKGDDDHECDDDGGAATSITVEVGAVSASVRRRAKVYSAKYGLDDKLSGRIMESSDRVAEKVVWR